LGGAQKAVSNFEDACPLRLRLRPISEKLVVGLELTIQKL